jgi:tetratricopeptide (TPR) repeat protein
MNSVLRILALIAAAFGIYRLCVVPYRDNLLLGEVAQRSAQMQSLRGSEAQSIATTNLRQLDLAERSCRLDPNWYLLYGGNCELLDRWHDALIVYTRGLQIDHRPELYEARGLVLQHLGQTADAEADLVTAARFNPGVLNDLDETLRARIAAAIPRGND